MQMCPEGTSAVVVAVMSCINRICWKQSLAYVDRVWWGVFGVSSPVLLFWSFVSYMFLQTSLFFPEIKMMMMMIIVDC